MRNARKVTRRRSVKATLPVALLCAARRARRHRLRKQLKHNAHLLRAAPSSTWSATRPPNRSTRKPSSRPSKRPPQGKGVSFSNSFGASGDQSRAVVAGQPASVVHFSQAGDMERLVEEGELVSKNWEKQPYGGIATDSVVVILVAKGQPAGDQVLQGPARPKNAEVVTPNPFSSGSARWNIMAVYGTRDQEGASRPTRRWKR